MRTTGNTAITIISALLLAAVTTVNAGTSNGQTQEKAEAATPDNKQAAKSSRLRFRSGGPACMCATGLSEAEIEAAERRLRDAMTERRKMKQDK